MPRCTGGWSGWRLWIVHGHVLLFVLGLVPTVLAQDSAPGAEPTTESITGSIPRSISASVAESAAGLGSPRVDSLVTAALAQVGVTLVYDGSYRSIAYPGGDVPLKRGVCSDVIIRAYRHLGIDLQKLVHEDMMDNFAAYPQRWGLSSPDSNIDHRRVLNLMHFFECHGEAFPVSEDPTSYSPGDIVAWELVPGVFHIGLISARRPFATGSPLVIHNVGSGTLLEDFLFRFPIIGHYRY